MRVPAHHSLQNLFCRANAVVGPEGFEIKTSAKDPNTDQPNNQVSLIDSDELVNLIIHYYDNFDAAARSPSSTQENLLG